ncbi:LysM peptidoglycan-binding domain-containing protein [Paucisalibacillus globulus]|uniref:LysM peptidoglycan-binding domain-containing protein n=1 Tax=Paucisalibacillus globulus TaxID=351095 RepID=UPI000BB7041B|nr:LysM peptidoglycan-binding domain-containing protein [Paucisalibacillus globulus]
MGPFTRYKINETEDGIEVILYMDENLTEFSSELGIASKDQETNIEKEAVSFVKKRFPSLKVKSVKVMAGAMLLTSIGIGALPMTKASAAEATVTQSRTDPSSYIVSPGDTLYSIAKQKGTTVDAIKQTNHLSSDLLSIGQKLTIPTGTTSAPFQAETTSYKIVSGDTLYSIAKQNGTTVDAIKQANNLSSNILSIGQTLRIPSGNTSQTAPTPIETPSPAPTTSYKVVSGDTLYSVAQQNGTTVDAIKQANNLSTNTLSIGQALTIPSSGSPAPLQTTTTTHTVVSGDTLFLLAKGNGTTVDAIKQANNLSSDILNIGQKLIIPTGVTVTTPTTNSSVQSEQEIAVNQEEVEWLAKMIYSEGRGESLEGQIAIGAVIMNRVNSPLFPNDVKSVLFEKSYGYYQFTPAETGVIHTAKPNAQNYEAAERAINGEAPTNGALFFYNPDKTSSSYLRSRDVSTTIGNHIFAF